MTRPIQLNEELKRLSSPFVTGKDQQRMNRFIKKMRQFSQEQRIAFTTEMHEEGEHGISTAKIFLFRLFYPETQLSYSSFYCYGIEKTQQDYDVDKKLKIVHAYASLYWHLSKENKQKVLDTLKQRTLMDPFIEGKNKIKQTVHRVKSNLFLSYMDYCARIDRLFYKQKERS